MEGNLRFSIFDRNIISDVFGEEVVLVNLESGVYYSLRASATEVWKRLQNNYSVNEIVADLKLLYQCTDNEIDVQTTAFLQQLMDQQLIKVSVDEQKIDLPVNQNQEKLNFTAPIVEVFSDMQEILLLDPVHDVDKAGWPISKDNNDTSK